VPCSEEKSKIAHASPARTDLENRYPGHGWPSA